MEIIDPQALRLFYDPPGTLRLTVGEDRCYPNVKLYQASPLLRPGRYLSLQNGKGEEIVLVENLADFAPESRAVAEEELKRRYLTARIQAIPHIRTEFGVTYWHVVTDRGERDFVVQSLSESCVWLGDQHIVIIDVDGNRFEILDRTGLDEASRARLESVLSGSQRNKMRDIPIRGEYITLGQLLKLAGLLQSGGETRSFLAGVPIRVNGESEERRGRKLRPGDVIAVEDQEEIRLTTAPEP